MKCNLTARTLFYQVCFCFFIIFIFITQNSIAYLFKLLYLYSVYLYKLEIVESHDPIKQKNITFNNFKTKVINFIKVYF